MGCSSFEAVINFAWIYLFLFILNQAGYSSRIANQLKNLDKFSFELIRLFCYNCYR